MNTTVDKKAPKKNYLKVEEICAIIEQCSKHSVEYFRYEQLEIKCRARKFTEEEVSPISPVPPTSQELEHAHSETMAMDEIRSKQDQIDHLLVENPSQAEDLMAMGELEDETSRNETLDGESEED